MPLSLMEGWIEAPSANWSEALSDPAHVGLRDPAAS
jgi:hypothetical protein